MLYYAIEFLKDKLGEIQELQQCSNLVWRVIFGRTEPEIYNNNFPEVYRETSRIMSESNQDEKQFLCISPEILYERDGTVNPRFFLATGKIKSTLKSGTLVVEPENSRVEEGIKAGYVSYPKFGPTQGIFFWMAEDVGEGYCVIPYRSWRNNYDKRRIDLHEQAHKKNRHYSQFAVFEPCIPYSAYLDLFEPHVMVEEIFVELETFLRMDEKDYLKAVYSPKEQIEWKLPMDAAHEAGSLIIKKILGMPRQQKEKAEEYLRLVTDFLKKFNDQPDERYSLVKDLNNKILAAYSTD